MDTKILGRVWNYPSNTVFTPVIQGWTTLPNGKRKSSAYVEGKAYMPKDVLERLEKNGDKLASAYDLYFCPVQFRGIKRSKSEVVDNLQVLWADLDDADPRKISPVPTIAWHSSDTHYQALWLLDKPLPTAEIEALNKSISYAVGADKSGWDLTQLLRVPGSTNHKYGTPQPCTLLWDDGHVYTEEELKKILTANPEATAVTATSTTLELISSLPSHIRLSKRALELLNASVADGDRSERLWELEKLLVEAGVPIGIAFNMLKASVWNKFSTRKGGDDQLMKELLKAETEYKTKPKEAVIEMAKSEVLTFSDFMHKAVPRPSFLVNGFIQKDSVGIVAGEPKTMKSTLMLDMAISVASGTVFLNRYKCKSTPVMYIQEENNEAEIKRRLLKIALSKRIVMDTPHGYEALPIPLYVRNNQGLDLVKDEGKKYVEDEVRDKKIKMLILDPFYMMAGDIDENSATDISPVLKFLTSLRNNYGCTVVLVHHFKKGDASRGGQRMRGSSVFHAWVENGLYLELNKGTAGDVLVEREFRAFPSNSGLNLVWNNSDDEYYYSVEVKGGV